MASTQLSLLLSVLRFLLLPFFFSVAIAQVPANQTFKIINDMEFGDRIIEYDAGYRVIRAPNNNFYTHPFRLCFYNTTPNAFVLAIRAGIPNEESLMRWVWDANRNHPVRENALLSFGTDGNLALTDIDGKIAWQTNTANKGVTGIAMLNTGNLVLYDKNGKYVWQSFDHPTDTLLVGQSVRLNGTSKLVSRKSDQDGSDGPYSMVIEPTGFIMYYTYDRKRLRYGGWPTAEKVLSVAFDAVQEDVNSTMFELVLAIEEESPASPPPSRHLLQSYPISNSRGQIIRKINYNGTISFLRLGSDGNLRAYTYYDNAEYLKWEETFAFFSSYFIRECGLPSKCGSYGLCDNRMCVACPSPKGLLGWSKSCAPPKLGACKSGAAISSRVDYYKIVGVEHFLSTYLEGFGPMKVSDCRERCNTDCKCVGFFYREKSSKCLLAPVLGTLIKDVNTTHVGYIKYIK